MTDKLYGTWDCPSAHADTLENLFHALAAQCVGTSNQRSNSGLTQRKHEIISLWELYRRAKPKVVVEIGVAQGGTFAGWCALGEPDATIIGIDRCINDCLPRNNENVHPSIAAQKSYPMSEQGGGIFALGKKQQTIRAINGWSTEDATFNQLVNILAGRKIDWLWTDSSHEASMFAKEFEMYWPLVADGGVFCTHDVQKSSHPDVTKWREWERIKQVMDYSACFEFLGSRIEDSLGIGVLVR